MRVQVDFAEGGCLGDELAVNTRLIPIVQSIGHLYDDHSVEQRLILLLLEKLAEFRQVGVRDNRLVDVDQREARDLDVFFLSQREQQVEKLTLDLQDLDHLQQSAA